MDLEDPVEVALKMSEILAEAGIEHALYGALLLAAYGEARETRDADLAVVNVDVDPVLAGLRRAGIDAQEEFKNLQLGGLRASRISLFGTPEDPGMNNLDLLAPLSARFARSALTQSVCSQLRGRKICVLTPEDYVLFKVLSSRARDLSDGASVLEHLGAEVDRAYIDSEVALLSTEIPEHPVKPRWEEMCDLRREHGA